MPRFAPVTPERYGQKRWLAPSDLAFSAREMAVPIVAAELPAAVLAMPCAFVQQDRRYTLVAVLSPMPDRNMFVAADGRWMGDYIPAALRLYPFRMLPAKGSDNLLLCIDEDSKLVVDGAAGGQPFFDEAGQPSAALKGIFDAVTALERNRKLTEAAVAALAQVAVIRPWPITITFGGAERKIEGLHRIDEAAFRALTDDVFLGLRSTNALAVAYAQLLSTHQLRVFQRLEKVHASAAASAPATAALPPTLDGLLEALNWNDMKAR